MYGEYMTNVFAMIGGSDHWTEIDVMMLDFQKVSREVISAPPKKPHFVDDEQLNDLLHTVLAANPNTRPSIFDMLRHAYFGDYDMPLEISCKERLEKNKIKVSIPDD